MSAVTYIFRSARLFSPFRMIAVASVALGGAVIPATVATGESPAGGQWYYIESFPPGSPDYGALAGFGNSNAVCLDVDGASLSAGAQVLSWPCNFNSNETWKVLPEPSTFVLGNAIYFNTGNNYFQVENQNSGQCLTVDNNSLDAGDPIIQYPCDGNIDQIWSYSGSGSLNSAQGLAIQETAPASLTALSSGLTLDLYGAYSQTWVDQWYANGGWNQQFSFVQNLPDPY